MVVEEHFRLLQMFIRQLIQRFVVDDLDVRLTYLQQICGVPLKVTKWECFRFGQLAQQANSDRLIAHDRFVVAYLRCGNEIPDRLSLSRSRRRWSHTHGECHREDEDEGQP